MTEYIWKRLKDVELPRCVLCKQHITEDYYTEIDSNIICEICAQKVSIALSQL